MANMNKKEEEHKDHEEHKALPDRLQAIARDIVDAGLKVHKAVGPGVLESTYGQCRLRELSRRGLYCQRQVTLPIIYENEIFDAGYRLDILLEKSVIMQGGTKCPTQRPTT